jgi:hypothetical protein
MNSQQIIEIIEKEIEWCKQNSKFSSFLPEEYKKGFLSGLYQAIHLIYKGNQIGIQKITYSQSIQRIPERPKRLCGRIRRETDSGPFCPTCNSSQKWQWWNLFHIGKSLGCIQPKCNNYYCGANKKEGI